MSNKALAQTTLLLAIFAGIILCFVYVPYLLFFSSLTLLDKSYTLLAILCAIMGMNAFYASREYAAKDKAASREEREP